MKSDIKKEDIVFCISVDQNGKLKTYGHSNNFHYLPSALGIAMIEVPNMFRFFMMQQQKKEMDNKIIMPESRIQRN